MTGNRTRRNVLVPLLFVICCLLGAAVWAQWRDPDLLVHKLVADTQPQLPSVATGNVSSMKLPSAAVPPESAFVVIAQRPLFMQSRRAPEMPAEPVVLNQADNSLPNLVVTGIVISSAESIAILEPVRSSRRPRNRKNQPAVEQALIVRVGDTVGGWTVESMEPNPDRVILARGNERRALELVADENRRRAGQRAGTLRRQTPTKQPTQPVAPAPSGQAKADE